VAADLTGAGADIVPAPALQQQATLPTADHRPHRLRFGVIYGGLGAILVVAVAGVVVFAGRSINPAPPWSSWKPKGGGLGAAQEIADHVAKAYRLPNGDQLVDVISKAPSLASPTNSTVPIHYVAVRGAKSKGDQLYPVTSTNSVMYSLCGLGTSCAIATGKASVERGRLVRREILELALYTFKYAAGIQNVIAFIPPKAGKQPYVVYLRSSDVAGELKQPLETTLGANVPPLKAIPAREVHAIEATTGPRVYSFNATLAPQGDLVFVLAPVPV
jgi:hypothetical protein